ncbi:MAG: hypothetical protein ACOVLE_08275 [Pirellula staleyi]
MADEIARAPASTFLSFISQAPKGAYELQCLYWQSVPSHSIRSKLQRIRENAF